MNFVDDERIGLEDVALLEPATRDSGRDDDDVPRRRFWRRLALAIDDADSEVGVSNELFGDRSDGECFSGPGTGDDPESCSRSCQLANTPAVVLLEIGLDVEPHR